MSYENTQTQGIKDDYWDIKKLKYMNVPDRNLRQLLIQQDGQSYLKDLWGSVYKYI
jgi:hypothetical protein